MKRVPLGRAFALAGEVRGSARRFLLKPGLNRIGALANNQVILPEQGISRRHANLVIQADRLCLEDLASKNGTFVNGRRVEAVTTLRVGDELQIGPIHLRVEAVHELEAEIAIDLQGQERRSPAGRGRSDTATVVFALDPDPVRTTLEILERIVNRLCSSPEGDPAAALSQLVSEVGGLGACVLEMHSEHRPLVVACYGELREQVLSPAQAALQGGQPSAGGVQVQRFSPETTEGLPLVLAVLTTTSARRTALGIWGELTEPRACEPILAVLVRLVAHFRSRSPGARPGVRPPLPSPGEPELDVPEAHVRGNSPLMSALYQQMRALARSDLPVLILGETGVGKEDIAGILQASSDRRDRPFVVINCAAIPAELLEAELFGIGKGVATGVDERQGIFENAHGGTLFLDEIGDMSKDLQAKLLRALQEKEIHPVGRPPVSVDVRVIAATNTDLEQRMESGSFRRDLYYRLAGFVLRVPALRERREDIPALVEHFLRTYSAAAGKSILGVTVLALSTLVDRPWAGNVRELEHEMRRLVYFCPDHQAIDSVLLLDPPEDEGSSYRRQGAEALSLRAVDHLALAAVEKQVIKEALRRCRGNRTRAAKILGISREALHRRLRRFDLQKYFG